MAEVFRTVTATHASFIAETRQLEIIFNNGAEYRWPVDSLEMLVFRNNEWVPLTPRPSDEQLKKVEIWPGGEIVEFGEIGQGFEISELVRGRLGSERWMRSLLGK
ncbi:MAG: hypothetical protein AAFP20_13140 [Cyanobacteria bacterium J06614_10]